MPNGRRSLTVLAGLAPAGMMAALLWRHASDDAYITYTYVRNLLEHGELAFNLGERVFGQSDPGVALLLAVLGLVSRLDVPALGTLLTALALAGCALVPPAPMSRRLLAAVLIGSSPLLWSGQGTGPVVALAVLLLATRVAPSRPATAGLIAGIAVWCRPDAGLAAGLLALVAYGVRPSRRQVVYLAGLGVVVAIGLLMAQLYFGEPLPATLGAKQAFMAGDDPRFAARAFEALLRLYSPAGAWLLLVGGALGLGVVLVRRREPAAALLAGWGVLSTVLYAALGVPFFTWYVAPLAVALLYGLAALPGELAAPRSEAEDVSVLQPSETGEARVPGAPPQAGMDRAFSPSDGVTGTPAVRSPKGADGLGTLVRAFGPVGRGGVIGVGVALVVAVAGWGLRGTIALAGSTWRADGYAEAGRWIDAHAAPGASVAAAEIGYLGYFGRRRVVDLVGLVTPASTPYVRVGDQLGAFLVEPADLVLFHTFFARGGTGPVVRRPWFGDAYREAASFGSAEWGEGRIVLYEVVDRSAIPPPRPPFRRPEFDEAGEGGVP